MDDEIDAEGRRGHRKRARAPVEALADLGEPRIEALGGPLIEGREGADDAGAAGLDHEVGA